MYSTVLCPLKVKLENKHKFWTEQRLSLCKYEVGRQIMTGRICWLNGPIAGNPNDIQIFHDCLRQRVEENEKILTSNIHTPSAFFSHPRNQNWDEQCAASRCYAFQNKLDSNLKSFGALQHKFYHDRPLETHGVFFRTAAMISELMRQRNERVEQLNKIYALFHMGASSVFQLTPFTPNLLDEIWHESFAYC